ncbi:hypothetical protein HON52_02665 [Candidatus Uhrbacteria bacterium]|jgi:hypothetical protein|nr:hypothetical protein [Candidatus Uhrbacteria bacterium]
MKVGKSIDAYATLVERAWTTTWNHKEWWIVAAVAGLANTGGVFSSVFNTFWHLRPADTISADTIVDVFPIVGWFLAYVRNMIALDTGDRLISVGILIVVLLAILIAIVTCQHLLLRAIKKGHKKTQEFTRKNIKKDLSHIHIARLFSVDAFFSLSLTLLVTGSAIPLSLLLTDYVGVNLFLYAGIYSIILPIAFLVNIVGMMALIFISQKDLSLFSALREGLYITQKHWLSALELSLVLFFINMVASIIFFFFLFIVAIGAGLLFELAFAANAYLLMSIITFVGILLAGAVVVIYAGAITMFNYSVWSGYAKLVRRAKHSPIMEYTFRLFSRS